MALHTQAQQHKDMSTDLCILLHHHTCRRRRAPHIFKNSQGTQYHKYSISKLYRVVLYTHCTMSHTYSIVKQHLITLLKSSLGHPGHKPSQLYSYRMPASPFSMSVASYNLVVLQNMSPTCLLLEHSTCEL